MIVSLLRMRGEERVAVYSVHEPAEVAADPLDRAQSLVFVRDGFSLGVALLGVVWLALAGEWLAFAIGIAVVGFVAAIGALFAASPDAIGLAVLGINVVLGFERATLSRWSLGLMGFREIGAVSGRNRDECERRFFEHWHPDDSARSETGVVEGTKSHRLWGWKLGRQGQANA